MKTLQLLPIKQTEAENEAFASHPDCRETLSMCINYYTIVGYAPPWICYYVQMDGELVASAAYKGAPKENKVEIAYGTFPAYQQKGVATDVCRQLVQLAQETDPDVIITARTFSNDNFSSKVLLKNNFVLQGTVWDEEDGEVWEWVYNKENSKI